MILTSEQAQRMRGKEHIKRIWLPVFLDDIFKLIWGVPGQCIIHYLSRQDYIILQSNFKDFL